MGQIFSSSGNVYVYDLQALCDKVIKLIPFSSTHLVLEMLYEQGKILLSPKEHSVQQYRVNILENQPRPY